MGQCFSTAVQQVVTELQQEDNENNKPQQNQQQQQQNQPSTSATTTTTAVAPTSWAQAAGGGKQGDYNQQSQHTTNATTTTTTTPVTTSSSNKVSPIYAQLPSDAEQIHVRNVYDGDTMTLIDERRVRLLGIDTPEIKEEQPYAQDAKLYTKNLIDKYHDHVYLSYEPNQSKEDHYGRLLGYVYVRTNLNQYLCINEGIVEAGLASVYAPNTSSKIQKYTKYVTLQNIARTQHRGIWKDFQGNMIVYKTMNGTAYHKKSCSHISHSHNLIELQASIATEQGLHPCRTCCTSGAA